VKPGRWRIAAGAAALAVLMLFAARLLPPYWRNLEFQRVLEDTAQRAAASGEADDPLRVKVVNAAARLGLAVGFEQVRVRRAQGRLEIEVLYTVPVGLPLYSVDLHFRPRARVP
jgi:hypothetical protein